MTADLMALAAMCGPDLGGEVSTLGFFGAMLLAGLGTSLVHCAAMCGPFVLGQVETRLSRVAATGMCESARLANGLLLPYHLGRLTTYGLLGSLAGITGGGLAALPAFGNANAILLALAGLAMILVPLSGHRIGGSRAGKALARFARPFAELPTSFRGYGLGLVLGLLPCGAVYGALLAASAAGRPLAGAATMIVFGLGTVPTLAAIGIFGNLAARQWRERALKVRPAILAANGAFLLLLAWRAVS